MVHFRRTDVFDVNPHVSWWQMCELIFLYDIVMWVYNVAAYN